MNETPEMIHGRLLEAVHLSGYTFERACKELKWLLEENRWKSIGQKFEHIDDFLKSLDFSAYNIAIEQRKELSKMLSDLRATQRATAKMLGVSKDTIRLDVGEFSPKAKKESLKSLEKNKQVGEFSPTPPAILAKSGAEAAKLAEKAGLKGQAKEERLRAEENIQPEAVNLEIRKGDFKEVLSDLYDIDAIITDPPYPHEFINCFSDLSLFCKDHLKQDGFVAVYSGQYHLPEVIHRLSEHLTYVWTFCLYHVGQKQIVNHINLMCGWKPVVILSKGNKKMPFTIYDVLISDKREKTKHEWQQSESGVENLVLGLTKPEDLIVDPFTGSGAFGIVAKNLGRNFIGAEIK